MLSCIICWEVFTHAKYLYLLLTLWLTFIPFGWWVGPDQNRKWSRSANEYIPVPAYSHRFHCKIPEKHLLTEDYKYAFSKEIILRFNWTVTHLRKVYFCSISDGDLGHLLLYFRFCQGWYCSHDRIVDE